LEHVDVVAAASEHQHQKLSTGKPFSLAAAQKPADVPG
jgi:hypothetical protein